MLGQFQIARRGNFQIALFTRHQPNLFFRQFQQLCIVGDLSNDNGHFAYADKSAALRMICGVCIAHSVRREACAALRGQGPVGLFHCQRKPGSGGNHRPMRIGGGKCPLDQFIRYQRSARPIVNRHPFCFGRDLFKGELDAISAVVSAGREADRGSNASTGNSSPGRRSGLTAMMTSPTSPRLRNASTARRMTVLPPSTSASLLRGPPNRIDLPAAGKITAS